MKKIFLILTIVYYCCFIDLLNVRADVAGLIPCKESPQFEQRLDGQVKKLEQRLNQYKPDTPPALALQKQIDRTQTRFNQYAKSGVLCGSDGLPHLITDGRWNHAGEFIFPGLLFIYITGWIGWVGRGYLRAIALTNKPTEKEIIIDVPLAFKFSLSGFIWPLAAIQAFTSGDLLNSNDDITVSPR